MLQLPCNQKLMKEQDGLKQESVMMMSNKQSHSPHPTPPILWISYICKQSETTDKIYPG